MVCYHGTANYNLESFISQGIVPRHRQGHRRKSFCASLSVDEGMFFALRKTPANDLLQTGIVLEFQGNLVEGRDYILYQDTGMLRDEREVRIFNTEKLYLVAYWDFKHTWERISIGGER